MMTPPASPRLPESVEQDPDVYDLLTPDGRGKAHKREALARLLAKVGAARERQGIERARGRLMEMVEEYGAMAEASASDEYRVKANGLGIAYVRLGALPVDGEKK